MASFLLLALFPFLCLAIMFASCVSFLKYLFAFIIVKPFVIPFPLYHRLLKDQSSDQPAIVKNERGIDPPQGQPSEIKR